MLGFQLTTFLISMCIVNTAAVAMVLPILTAVTSELYSKSKNESNDSDICDSNETSKESVVILRNLLFRW